MYRILFAICILLGGTAYAATSQPNLSGTWIPQPQKSTGDLSQLQGNRLVIDQTGDAVSFDYYRGTKPVSSETIVADGQSKVRYKTRLYVAYGTARWQKAALVIDTQWVLNNEGTQTYTTTERWEVSKDRKTLYKKTSDGVIVFSREEAPAPSPPSASR
jgi:hypothetical protein